MPKPLFLGMACLVGVLGAGRAGAEADRRAPRPDAVPATVVLSNRKTLAGWLHLTPSKRLRVWDCEGRTYRDLSLREVERIEVKVEARRSEREWYFKEEGNPEKVFTGRVYPRLDFSFVLTLRDGRRLTCDLHSGQPLYLVMDDGTRKRFILQPHLRGEIGQTHGRLIYPKEILLGVEKGKEKRSDEEAARTVEPTGDTSKAGADTTGDN